MRGMRTNCLTGEKREVVLDYKIVELQDGQRIFQLIGGPTGYESFYITDGVIADYTDPSTECWVACMGDVGYKSPRYDRLEIPAEEMRKALGVGSR